MTSHEKKNRSRKGHQVWGGGDFRTRGLLPETWWQQQCLSKWQSLYLS